MPNRRDANSAGRGEGPAPSAGIPWELPHTFLGLDETATSFERASAVLLPVPYEATTSYGGGARAGPRAILEASRYVELYDQELDAEVGPALGIHTLPAVELTREGPAAALSELREAYARVLEEAGERFVLMLGGEHSISSAAILSHAERPSERLTVLQLDAHADLRASHEGTAWSHASTMARIVEVADVVSVGVRGACREEVEVARREEGITLVWADEMWEGEEWVDRVLAALGPEVYLTFDVDYFDPSLVPSTGTPEPGGGDWYRTLRFLRRVFGERDVVGCDVVELAPIPGFHAPDFLVAKLVYKLLGYRFQDRF